MGTQADRSRHRLLGKPVLSYEVGTSTNVEGNLRASGAFNLDPSMIGALLVEFQNLASSQEGS